MTQVETQDSMQAETSQAEERELYGLVAEFDDVTTVMNAARAVREAGYQRFDVHSPFPIHGIDDAMGIRPTILPWIVLVAGLTGCASGLFLTIWTMSTSFEWVPFEALKGYEYLISGKPLNSMPAWIPVIFELTILLSAFGAVFGMLILNKLPMLYHPLFKIDRFRRVTDDRFFLAIEARDEQFALQATAQLLKDQGATVVEEVDE